MNNLTTLNKKYLSPVDLAVDLEPLDLAGAGSDMTWGSFWALLTEETPAAPLLLKLCHVNPV